MRGLRTAAECAFRLEALTFRKETDTDARPGVAVIVRAITRSTRPGGRRRLLIVVRIFFKQKGLGLRCLSQ